MDRRRFLQHTAAAGLGSLITADGLLRSPLILTPQRTKRRTEQGELIFRPYIVQKGRVRISG